MSGGIVIPFGPTDEPEKWRFGKEHMQLLLIASDKYEAADDKKLFTLPKCLVILKKKTTKFKGRTVDYLDNILSDLRDHREKFIPPGSLQFLRTRFRFAYAECLADEVKVLDKQGLMTMPTKAVDRLCISLLKWNEAVACACLNDLWETDKSENYPRRKKGKEWVESDVVLVFDWLKLQPMGGHPIYVKWRNVIEKRNDAHKTKEEKEAHEKMGDISDELATAYQKVFFAAPH
ncbi:MAG: hypothetical protein LQ352_004499 [Teloschistes flavicans]|nr:MAG: hypothetical protein LQ352_004499 [Teloschistes flavicans]